MERVFHWIGFSSEMDQMFRQLSQKCLLNQNREKLEKSFLKAKDFFSLFQIIFLFWHIEAKKGQSKKKISRARFFFESPANFGQSMSTDKFFSKWCNSLLHEIEVHLDLKKRKPWTVSFVPSHWSLSSWKINRLFEKERERERKGKKIQMQIGSMTEGVRKMGDGLYERKYK